MAKGRKTGGRKTGTPNKATRTVREAFVEAFAIVDRGPTALAVWGAENPEKFYTLATKLIPTAVEASVTVALLPASERDARAAELLARLHATD
jgi:hypothetical protein